MQFLVNGMLSAMLGIVHVDIMEEFDTSALIFVFVSRIHFWKFMYFENTVCSLGTLANYLLIELKIILKNYKT